MNGIRRPDNETAALALRVVQADSARVGPILGQNCQELLYPICSQFAICSFCNRDFMGNIDYISYYEYISFTY